MCVQVVDGRPTTLIVSEQDESQLTGERDGPSQLLAMAEDIEVASGVEQAHDVRSPAEVVCGVECSSEAPFSDAHGSRPLHDARLRFAGRLLAPTLYHRQLGPTQPPLGRWFRQLTTALAKGIVVS